MKKAMLFFIVLSLVCVLFAGCGRVNGAIDSVDQIPGNFKTLGTKVDTLNENARKEILAQSLTSMETPENTQNLYPPLGMIAAGREFANAATADEIVGLTNLNLKEIEIKPEDSLKQNGVFPPSIVESLNHRKIVKVMEIRIIAAMAPQSIIENMVATQINQDGPYQTAAFALLAARAAFISQIFLDQDLLANTLTTIGQFEQAIGYALNLRYLINLPYQNNLVLRTSGIFNADGSPSDLNANDTINVPHITQQIQSIKELFYQNLYSQQFRNARVLRLKIWVDRL